MKVITVLDIIRALRETDPYIEMIFMQGGCYQFYEFLHKLYPYDAELYINKEKNHVVTRIKGRYYDITGVVSREGYEKATDYDKEIARKWNFSKQKMLQIGECPVCEEPICV